MTGHKNAAIRIIPDPTLSWRFLLSISQPGVLIVQELTVEDDAHVDNLCSRLAPARLSSRSLTGCNLYVNSSSLGICYFVKVLRVLRLLLARFALNQLDNRIILHINTLKMERTTLRLSILEVIGKMNQYQVCFYESKIVPTKRKNSMEYIDKWYICRKFSKLLLKRPRWNFNVPRVSS